MSFAARIRHLGRAAALGLIASAAWTLAAWAEPVTLTILHVNDLDRMEEQDGRGGVARLAAVVDRVRQEAGHVLVTHGGDAISPSLMSSFDQGAHIIDLFNAIGLDAMAIGNHEFDFGPEVLARRIAEARFPMLSANAVDPDGSLIDGARAHVLVERGGYRIGIFGLTTVGTAVKSSPGPVTFRDPVAVAREQAAALRAAGADLVIALAHTDRGEDAALFASRAADLILSGDDHILAIQYDGRTALVESAAQAEYVTAVELRLDRVRDRQGGTRVVWTPAFRAIDTGTVTPDPRLAAQVAGYQDKLSAELDVAIGTTETELDSRRSTVRGGEAAIGNLIADAMRQAVGADVAITNGGGIRADRVYPPGTTLTRRDIQSELPFGNRTVSLKVTGAVLKAALENGFNQVEQGSGRFPQVSGLVVTYDPAAPAGRRVRSVMVNGRPLDESATYVLATNDFMARGGDGYAMLADAPRIVDEIAGRLMAAQVMAYIQSRGSVAPRVEGRITAVR